MPIRRCSEQSRSSLEEFYEEVFANKKYDPTGVGKEMLQLISEINNLFKQTQLWGLTSHARLVIQNANNSASDWYVIISGRGLSYFTIKYLLPSHKRPWANAQVIGDVDSLANAINYLLIAMRESEGWSGNEELKKLLAERNL